MKKTVKRLIAAAIVISCLMGSCITAFAAHNADKYYTKSDTGLKCRVSMSEDSSELTFESDGDAGYMIFVEYSSDGKMSGIDMVNLSDGSISSETAKDAKVIWISSSFIPVCSVKDGSSLINKAVADEKEIIGYFTEIVEGEPGAIQDYKNGGGSDEAVLNAYKLLTDCCSGAIGDYNNGKGKFISKDYVYSEYDDEISGFKAQYKAFNDSQKNAFEDIAISICSVDHLKYVLDYLSISY